MAQISEAVKNARLNAIETVVGTAPILRVYDGGGSIPADCSQAVVGTLLVEITLPSNWLNDANGGSITGIMGTWSDTALATGETTYFRIYASNGTDCHIQGTVSQTGFGGDLTFESTEISSIGETVTVATFALSEPS